MRTASLEAELHGHEGRVSVNTPDGAHALPAGEQAPTRTRWEGEEFAPRRDAHLAPGHSPSCLLKDAGPELSSCSILPTSPQTKEGHTQNHPVNLCTPLATVFALFPPSGLSLLKEFSRPAFQPPSCHIHALSLLCWALHTQKWRNLSPAP